MTERMFAILGATTSVPRVAGTTGGLAHQEVSLMDAAKRTCSIPGCSSPHCARGLCNTHYAAARKRGDFVPRPKRAARSGPVPMTNGYLRVWCPGHPVAQKDGYALMHRKVWFDAHGAIPKGSHVHHKNGIKTDNRIENLELLTGSDHLKHHVAEAGMVTNQYGVWELVSGPCKFPGCERAAQSRGLCARCNQRVYKLGWKLAG